VGEYTPERIQRNNEVFRGANERIRGAVEEHAHELEQVPFLCECPVEDCVEIIRMTEKEYAGIRSNPNLYVTAVGHESADAPVGQVVARRDGYVVVEKS
jgi:hypothetical protein